MRPTNLAVQGREPLVDLGDIPLPRVKTIALAVETVSLVPRPQLINALTTLRTVRESLLKFLPSTPSTAVLRARMAL